MKLFAISERQTEREKRQRRDRERRETEREKRDRETERGREICTQNELH